MTFDMSRVYDLEIGGISEAELVKLRYFVGMSHQEIATELGLSEPTVRRHWAYARSWLTRAALSTCGRRKKQVQFAIKNAGAYAARHELLLVERFLLNLVLIFVSHDFSLCGRKTPPANRRRFLQLSAQSDYLCTPSFSRQPGKILSASPGKDSNARANSLCSFAYSIGSAPDFQHSYD